MSKKSNVETMGKAELRAACKAAGISYGKLTVAGMRDALKIRAAVNAVDGRSAPAEVDETVVAQQVEQVAPVTTPAAATESPAVAPPAAAARVKAPKAPKAPKVPAEVRNGITRPRAGGACDAIWKLLDLLHAAGTVPTSKDARDLATANGLNVGNALCEISRWKRFHGLAQPRA